MKRLSASQHLKFAALMRGKAQVQTNPMVKKMQTTLANTHLKLARKAAMDAATKETEPTE